MIMSLFDGESYEVPMKERTRLTPSEEYRAQVLKVLESLRSYEGRNVSIVPYNALVDEYGVEIVDRAADLQERIIRVEGIFEDNKVGSGFSVAQEQVIEEIRDGVFGDLM